MEDWKNNKAEFEMQLHEKKVMKEAAEAKRKKELETIKVPTKDEIVIMMEDIQKRRTDILDKHEIFGGGEIVNMQMDVLNKSYDKLQKQLDTLNEQE